MINLKDNIWIEGFDDIKVCKSVAISKNNDFLYFGKTSEIPEGLAKMCVLNWRTDGLYNNYKIKSQYEEYMFKTAKASIQSACNKLYCIIFKKTAL